MMIMKCLYWIYSVIVFIVREVGVRCLTQKIWVRIPVVPFKLRLYWLLLTFNIK